jgi:hypothetical protein
LIAQSATLTAMPYVECSAFGRNDTYAGLFPSPPGHHGPKCGGRSSQEGRHRAGDGRGDDRTFGLRPVLGQARRAAQPLQRRQPQDRPDRRRACPDRGPLGPSRCNEPAEPAQSRFSLGHYTSALEAYQGCEEVVCPDRRRRRCWQASLRLAT